MGLSASGTDILNPNTSAAEANRLNMEASHQQAVYEQQERLVETQTDAQIQDIRREQKLQDAQLQHDKEALIQDLANQQKIADTWMMIIKLLGGALSLAIVIVTIFWISSRPLTTLNSTPQPDNPDPTPPTIKTVQPLPIRESYDPWASPSYRIKKRMSARQREIEDRIKMIVRLNAIGNPLSISKEEYNRLPHAE